MANMSYCRFENTLNALYDCHDAMHESTTKMNEHEARARLDMFDLIFKMANEIRNMTLDEKINGDPNAEYGEHEAAA